MPDDFGFDLYALVRPKNVDDVKAMLAEALSELGKVNQVLEGILSSE